MVWLSTKAGPPRGQSPTSALASPERGPALEARFGWQRGGNRYIPAAAGFMHLPVKGRAGYGPEKETTKCSVGHRENPWGDTVTSGVCFGGRKGCQQEMCGPSADVLLRAHRLKAAPTDDESLSLSRLLIRASVRLETPLDHEHHGRRGRAISTK